MVDSGPSNERRLLLQGVAMKTHPNRSVNPAQRRALACGSACVQNTDDNHEQPAARAPARYEVDRVRRDAARSLDPMPTRVNNERSSNDGQKNLSIHIRCSAQTTNYTSNGSLRSTLSP